MEREGLGVVDNNISHFEADVVAHDVVLQYVRFSVVLINKSSVAAVKGQTCNFLCLLDSN